MCIQKDYNNILEHGTYQEICDFQDKYCVHCLKQWSCDYLFWLDEKLVKLERAE